MTIDTQVSNEQRIQTIESTYGPANTFSSSATPRSRVSETPSKSTSESAAQVVEIVIAAGSTGA